MLGRANTLGSDDKRVGGRYGAYHGEKVGNGDEDGGLGEMHC